MIVVPRETGIIHLYSNYRTKVLPKRPIEPNTFKNA